MARSTAWPPDSGPPRRAILTGLDLLARHDVALVRADNPSPFTLSGTHTRLYGRHPSYVVDPGPLLGGLLVDVPAEPGRRGGLGGVAGPHSHADHPGAVEELRSRAGNPPLA